MTWSSRLEYLLSAAHRGRTLRAVKSLRAGCLKVVNCHVKFATLMALMGSKPCTPPAEEAEHAIPIHCIDGTVLITSAAPQHP
jgi:hypothetical protein